MTESLALALIGFALLALTVSVAYGIVRRALWP